ncbi:MAG: flagellar motor protein MotA [Bdellovibrionales bacterium RBG_16_40_8]|nr:MAG: flagellar motor protein MotA [Bdellovibrionales bacterium RBG_16_40_8]
MDITTILGIIIGIGGIVAGNIIEGGTFSSLLQLTAFFIVFGGTLGAVLVSNRWPDIKTGISLLGLCFYYEKPEEKRQIALDIVEAARIARKDSILGLESKLKNFHNDYLKVVMRYVIDGIDAKTLRDVFEAEIINEEEKMCAGAKIWSDAGGVSPTIGIIGAVLGLIHVMNHLSDTAQLGKGIAVAFVATIYGVGAANLIFIPIANKMKRKIREISFKKTLVVEGAVAIITNMNPYIIDEKMRALSGASPRTIDEVI